MVDLSRARPIHFVGIGGAGMSSLAEVLRDRGFRVSGSDASASATTARLAALGIPVASGHDAKNLGAAELVCWSSAIREDNPERSAALARGLEVVHRADLLASLVAGQPSIAVAGSHGKTSTTALIGHLLAAGGLDPTVVVGGVLGGSGSGARLGRGRWLVVEADESDGSFLKLRPTIAVVTNVDREHLDHHRDYAGLLDAFAAFAARATDALVLCIDDPGVEQLDLAGVSASVVTYGLGNGDAAEWRAENIRAEGLAMRAEIAKAGVPLGTLRLPLPGRHYVENTLAALAAAEIAGVPPSVAVPAVASFGGVERRFTIVGEASGVTVVDDYGHHPAEIRATLAAARAALPGRLVVLFQAHRYTRTRDLLDEFARAFADADLVVVTAIYGASEPPISGIDGAALARAIGVHREVLYVPDPQDVPVFAARLAQPGDTVLFLGAGDLNREAARLLALLAQRRADD